MPELVPFTAGHAVRLYDPDVGLSLEDAVKLADLKARSGPSWTAMLYGKPICAAGICIHWQGYGVAWGDFGTAVREWPLWVSRTTKREMWREIIAYELRRIEVVVRYPHEKAWAVFMGFRNPVLKEKYGPDGADYYEMTIIR